MKLVSIEKKNEKPRVRFCHDCSAKLYGNHHAIVKYENIDHEFIMHKDCADRIADLQGFKQSSYNK